MDAKIKGIAIIALAVLIPALILINYDYIATYDWSSLGYAGVFVVMLITSATVILPVPGLAVATIAGAFANPLMVGIVGGVGSALGEITGYMAGYGGSEIVDGKRQKQYDGIKNALMKKNADLLLIFALSIIPNPFFDVAGIAAGAIKYPLWKFIVACALGKIIKIAIFAYLGYLATGMI